MTQVTEDVLIAEIARDVVAETAPEELPLFRVVTAAYFDDPAGTLKHERAGDEMLGFGTDAAIALLTPVALAVTGEVVEFLAEEIEQSGEKGAAMVGDLLRRSFNRLRGEHGNHESRAPQPLTSEQFRQVRTIAFQKARQLDLPENRAGLLADSVVGCLATTER